MWFNMWKLRRNETFKTSKKYLKTRLIFHIFRHCPKMKLTYTIRHSISELSSKYLFMIICRTVMSGKNLEQSHSEPCIVKANTHVSCGCCPIYSYSRTVWPAARHENLRIRTAMRTRTTVLWVMHDGDLRMRNKNFTYIVAAISSFFV